MGTSNFYQDRQLGLTVIDITKAFAERLGYKGLAGVLIRDVDAGRIGAQAGLRRGTLITHVGGEPVQNVAEYEEAIKLESLIATPNSSAFSSNVPSPALMYSSFGSS